MGCGSGRPLSAASAFPAAAPAALGLQCLGCFHARFILLMPHSAERVESASRRPPCGMTAGENLQAQLCTTEFRGWEHARPAFIFRPDLGRKGRISFCHRRRVPSGGASRRLQLGWTPASEFPDMSLHYPGGLIYPLPSCI